MPLRLTLTIVIAMNCWSSFALAGQRYMDDFAQSPSVWRFGNVPRR